MSPSASQALSVSRSATSPRARSRCARPRRPRRPMRPPCAPRSRAPRRLSCVPYQSMPVITSNRASAAMPADRVSPPHGSTRRGSTGWSGCGTARRGGSRGSRRSRPAWPRSPSHAPATRVDVDVRPGRQIGRPDQAERHQDRRSGPRASSAPRAPAGPPRWAAARSARTSRSPSRAASARIRSFTENASQALIPSADGLATSSPNSRRAPRTSPGTSRGARRRRRGPSPSRRSGAARDPSARQRLSPARRACMRAAFMVFASSIAIVIRPTPPGTGVIAPATSLRPRSRRRRPGPPRRG